MRQSCKTPEATFVVYFTLAVTMTPTEIAAWYAATVSTSVFLWDIVKWFRNGPRLRINTKCNVSYPDGRVIERTQLEGGGEAATLADYCHIEVLNVGGQPTTLIDIQVKNEPSVNGRQVSYSGPAFLTHSGSKALPTLLGPGEMWSGRIEMTCIETIAENGRPIIQVRSSRNAKPIQVALDIKQGAK